MKETLRILTLLVLAGCAHSSLNEQLQDDLSGIPFGSSIQQEYPPFYTPTDQYFEYFSFGIPPIYRDNYRLKIYGELDFPVELSLDDLEKLPLVNQAQTVECIGNIATGNRIGTAIWTGFNVADLLDSLGMDPAAAGLKYVCADGYYSTTSMEILRNRNILGALYMNHEPVPLNYGYPLRIMNPGFYGVKNPGWVTEIEILNSKVADYWDSYGWKTSEPMAPDTKIFFPSIKTRWSLGDTIHIGGAAFGGRRISSVEISYNDGLDWQQVTITKSTNEDYVWVFWSSTFVPEEKGDYIVLTRAANEMGVWQPRNDDNSLDGSNGMPEIYLYVR